MNLDDKVASIIVLLVYVCWFVYRILFQSERW